MDDFLNLVSELEEENWKYDINVNTFDGEEFDYVLTCRTYYVTGTDRRGFDFDPLLRHSSEFDQLSIEGFIRHDGPYGTAGADKEISQHSVEIRVRE